MNSHWLKIIAATPPSNGKVLTIDQEDITVSQYLLSCVAHVKQPYTKHTLQSYLSVRLFESFPIVCSVHLPCDYTSVGVGRTDGSCCHLVFEYV